MSPNDDLDWIVQERKIITELLARKKPIIGFCYGAQQIAKTLGYKVTKSPYKEVGWAKVYRQCDINLELPGNQFSNYFNIISNNTMSNFILNKMKILCEK